MNNKYKILNLKKMRQNLILYFSGGIDSIFSILLLKILKYNIIAFYMINLILSKIKSTIILINYVSKIINLKFILIDVRSIYKKKIFYKFLKNYNNNSFINIDALCNKKIKYGLILNYFINFKKDGVKICSGHYSKIIDNTKSSRSMIVNCLDLLKNQNQFLHTLKSFEKCIFILGKVIKKNIKSIIIKYLKIYNLLIKSSKGICFFENKKFSTFLKNYIYKKKNFKELNNFNKKKNKNIIKISVLIKFLKETLIKKKYFYVKYSLNNSKKFFTCKLIILNKKNIFIKLKKQVKIFKGQYIYFIYKKKYYIYKFIN